MFGESPYHTMSEEIVAMEIDASDVSLYHQGESMNDACAPSLKTGTLELFNQKPDYSLVPVPVCEEVVVSAPGGVTANDTGSTLGPSFPVTGKPSEDDFMVELPLDQEEGEDDSRDSVQSDYEPVYTILQPAVAPHHGRWTSQLLSGDQASIDSGLGASERNSILSKKSDLSTLPSQDSDSTDLSSWKSLQPCNWSSSQVLDWLYHLAEQDNTNIDVNLLNGESFKDVTGATLCTWSEAEFIKADHRHGADIYINFTAQCSLADEFIAPDDVTDTTGYEHERFINPLINDMEDGSSPIRSELDPYLPVTSAEKLVNINGRHYSIDARDAFDDIPQNGALTQTSGVHTSFMHGSGGLVKEIASGGSRSCTLTLSGVAGFSPAPCSAQLHAPSPAPPTHAPAQVTPPKRRRGRPRKNSGPSYDEGSDGEYTPCKQYKQTGGQRGGPRGKRPHSNRMLHLWEFIRDLLLDPAHNPRVIRWENRREGVFRVVRSKDVAKMWGVRKQNPDMTYEKFSRSMRFCRTAEYFGEVPKDGKYPKKLCFAFGPRAHGWQPNSVISQCYYQKQ